MIIKLGLRKHLWFCVEEVSMNYQVIGEAIDRLITLPMSNWSINREIPMTEIYNYARQKAGEPLAMLAAKKIKEAIHPGDTALILTGFVMADWRKPETDGPIGAAALARSIELGTGAVPVLLTEDIIVENLQQTVKASGLVVYDSIEKAKSGRRGRKAFVTGFPLSHESAREEAIRLLDVLQPKVVISIERPGWNEKKEYHSGMGINISQLSAKLDYLFLEAQQRGILTIGVGDLGNELGMGYMKEILKKIIPGAEKCQCDCQGGIICDVSCDVGILCNISNWGGYGVCACLAALTGNREVLHDRQTEMHMINECVRAGAIDSVSGMYRPYVDGEPDYINGHIIDLLHRIVQHATDSSIFSMS
jgi:hypothetical protein